MLSARLAFLRTDKRVWLLMLTMGLAAALCFWTIPDAVPAGSAWPALLTALPFVKNFGFWFVLAAFGLFLHAVWQTFRDDLLVWKWRSVDWATVAVVVFGSSVLLVHEQFGFKILNDEISLLGTSMNMHFNKIVLMPTRGNDIQGTFLLLDGLLDKRPLFFPFLESIVHDLTGYRPENAFVLNGILTVVFLALVNAIGRLLAGRLAGWAGVALFAGLPLLAHNATGGGFELLNLVMILATLLLGIRFAERPDASSLTALVYCVLLLAQVRYESVLYLAPVAVLVLFIWWREQRTMLSWPILCAPLLMIHYPLQHRLFTLRHEVWELASKPGYTTPFSSSYIPENIAHAVSFFFARPADQPNSILFSALGCVAIPFFGLLILKRMKTLPAQSPTVLATTVFAFGFAAQFVLMMCYFWGKFDEPVIRRLSLPTHLGMLIAVLAVLPQFGGILGSRILLAAASLWVLASGVPSMAAHAYSREYHPGLETTWRRQFMKEQPRKDYLVIDNDAMIWITHQVSATPIGQAINRRDSIIFHMKNRTFSAIYVFQRFEIDADTGKMTLRQGDDLGSQFVLETVREERLKLLTLNRLSLLKEIRDGENVLSQPPAEASVPTSRAEIEQARRAYLVNYLIQLP
ncbi:MAG: glycosyltransferase family 39 protein [Opitutaceae bacterium]